jgi:hypothetical protein
VTREPTTVPPVLTIRPVPYQVPSHQPALELDRVGHGQGVGDECDPVEQARGGRASVRDEEYAEEDPGGALGAGVDNATPKAQKVTVASANAALKRRVAEGQDYGGAGAYE